MYVIEKIEETTTTWASGDYVIPLEAFDVDPSGKLKWEKELNKKSCRRKSKPYQNAFTFKTTTTSRGSERENRQLWKRNK